MIDTFTNALSCKPKINTGVLLSYLTPPPLVNQVEHIFLKFSQADKKQDSEAMVGEILEQYNTKAEKTGMKNFIISFAANQDSDDSDQENSGFSIIIQREV